MGIQATDTSYATTLAATTLEQWLPELTDNVFDENIVLKTIEDKGKVIARGTGLGVVCPILIGKNSGATSYSGYDKIDITPQAGMVDATIGWANYAVPVAISRQERRENSGQEAVVDLVEGKLMQAKETLQDLLSEHLFASAIGNGGKDLSGLPIMIAAQETANTFMGHSSTVWTNKYTSGTLDKLASLFGEMYRKLRDGATMPDMIITTDDGEAAYEALLTSSSGVDVGIRYTSNDKGDIGYAKLSYHGIPLVIDKHVNNYATGLPRYWFLNSKFLGLKKQAIESTPFIQAANQAAETCLILSDLQLFTNNRRRHGLLNVTALS